MKKFAVFDIDGTLIRWQLYHALVDRLAGRGALGQDAHQKLQKARMRWKRRQSKDGFSQYEAMLVKCYEAALTDIPTKLVDPVVDEVIAEYKDQAYTYTRDLIRHLKQSGYFLIAISGSHQELVAHIADYYGFDAYAGSLYERTGETFSGQTMIASHNKKQILSDFIKKHGLTTKASYAVGDSKSDAVMLEMVENPIAFNPDQSLFEIAQQHGWKVVVERKNMVYELEYKDGQYILAQTGE